MRFLEGFYQFFEKLISILGNTSLCEFDLPDSNFNIRLKSFRGEYYALFKIYSSGVEYTFEIPSAKLQWMLSKLILFYECGSQQVFNMERYISDHDEHMNFQFLKNGDELTGEFSTKFLFTEGHTYLSSRDLKIFYEKLKRYSAERT